MTAQRDESGRFTDSPPTKGRSRALALIESIQAAAAERGLVVATDPTGQAPDPAAQFVALFAQPTKGNQP